MRFQDWQKKVSEIFSAAEEKGIKGGEAWLRRGEEVLFYHNYGFQKVFPEDKPWKRGLILDVASLTKPLITALLLLILMEKGEVRPEDRLGKYFPDFPEDKKELILLELATHISGLPSWAPLYKEGSGRQTMLKQLLKLSLSKDRKVNYSCPGYFFLGLVVEKVLGMKLAEAARKELFIPLNLQRAFFNPPEYMRPFIVPTELGNKFEKAKAGKVKVKMRDYLIWGEVHDANCYFWGGDGGNAGAFLDEEAIAKLALQYTRLSLLLKEYLELSWRRVVDSRSFSWILRGELLMHTGFTGGLLLIHPKKEMVAFLYLNRTHPEVVEDISSMRQEFIRSFLEFLKQI